MKVQAWKVFPLYLVGVVALMRGPAGGAVAGAVVVVAVVGLGQEQGQLGVLP